MSDDIDHTFSALLSERGRMGTALLNCRELTMTANAKNLVVAPSRATARFDQLLIWTIATRFDLQIDYNKLQSKIDKLLPHPTSGVVPI